MLQRLAAGQDNAALLGTATSPFQATVASLSAKAAWQTHKHTHSYSSSTWNKRKPNQYPFSQTPETKDSHISLCSHKNLKQKKFNQSQLSQASWNKQTKVSLPSHSDLKQMKKDIKLVKNKCKTIQHGKTTLPFFGSSSYLLEDSAWRLAGYWWIPLYINASLRHTTLETWLETDI